MSIHIPVLLQECIEGLNIKPGGVYVDATLGRGGHTLEMAKRVGSGRIIAIDRDIDAISEAGMALVGYKERIAYVHGNFRDLTEIAALQGARKIDGLLLDLGMSSPQLDDGERGFSYMHEARLDMRMDRRDGLTAYDAVNGWGEERLREVFYRYGEERYSKPIARAIVSRREQSPLETTFELNDVIISAMPAAARREAQHPSKRCYQALRIAVNEELTALTELLGQVPGILGAGGRVCILSYQSLEDRLIKKAFADCAGRCVCPRDLPACVCGVKPTMKPVTKKPIRPSDEEVRQNPRARSAKLRIAEKI